MPNISHVNEVLKRKFYKYLVEVKGFSNSSVERYEDAIWLWQEFTENRNFFSFKGEEATLFKEWLKSKKKKGNNQELSLCYCYHIFRYLRVFFLWIADQKGGRSKINKSEIEYLRLAKKENQIVLNARPTTCPSMEDVRKTIESIEATSEVERRDKALLSLALLTGARIKALCTLTMQCFDENTHILYQDPKFGVDTKFSKRIVSVLLPLSYKETLEYFLDWYKYLRDTKNFKATDPIFPATKKMGGDESQFLGYYSNGEVSDQRWNTTGSARKVFENRFNGAGVKYYHPHSFRHLLVQEIMKMPLTEEEKKAISQNFGHENVGTTFGSYGYGNINEKRQIELLNGFGDNRTPAKTIYQLTEGQFLDLIGKVRNS